MASGTDRSRSSSVTEWRWLPGEWFGEGEITGMEAGVAASSDDVCLVWMSEMGRGGRVVDGFRVHVEEDDEASSASLNRSGVWHATLLGSC